MFLKQKILIGFFLFLFYTNQSQVAQNVVFDKVKSKGLTNALISCIFQDQKGYLWVGTTAGLNRYDGYNFINYRCDKKDSTTIGYPTVSAIAQYDGSQVMIGTRYGLNLYSYTTNKFKRVKIDSTVKNFPKRYNIQCIKENNLGQKIVGTSDGVFRYDPVKNTIEPFFNGKQNLFEGYVVQSMCFDRIGNLWAGVKKLDNGKLVTAVFRYSALGKKIDEIKILQGFNSEYIGISEDYLGNIWVAVDDGLVSINPSSYTQNYYKAPEGFYSNISYYHTKDNLIWQCYWSFGLTSFDIDKKEFKVYKVDPENSKSLMSNKCWSLCKDDNDILWVGTDVGLQKLTNSRPSVEVVKRNSQNIEASFLSNRVSAVLASESNNNIILAGIDGEGFSIYNRITKRAQNYGPNAINKNDERFVNHFYEDEKGDIYAAGGNNLNKISFVDGKIVVKTFFKTQEHYAYRIEKDPFNPDVLFIGGIGEIIIFNKSSETFNFIKEPAGVSQSFVSSFIFKGKVYFTHINGALRIDPSTLEMDDLRLPDIGNINSSVVLNDTTILLSSQYMGLVKLFPGSRRFETVFKGKSDFFPEISDLLVYKDIVWMASPTGLLKHNFRTNETSEVTIEDGLPTEIIHRLDILDGYLFIASQEGLVMFNPDYQASHFNMPKVEITSVQGISDPFSINTFLNGDEILITEKQNSFKINFTLLDFNLPEKNSFKYRLLPIEKEWQTLYNEHSVTFNALAAGTYSFELKGANADQNWSGEPIVLKIVIVPPFYKAKWFQLLVITIIFFGIILAIYLRIRIDRKKQILLEKIIKERTAEIQAQRLELLDSINYARRIQKALFVGEDVLMSSLPNSFIYNKPKDKLSGDFYWIGRHKDMLIVFVGDCTGHGVPGAMLSVVGTSILSKIVHEEGLYLPGEILTRLNHLFFKQLNLKEDYTRDGMDASIITINLVNKNVYFSAANNDAVYVEKDMLIELKSKRGSIGSAENSEFSTVTVSNSAGRFFYLYSDGVKDQFGGPKQKKLSSKRFKEILSQGSVLTIAEQKDFLHQNITSWKGETPQTDDMMVIGVKL
ncbi:MAG: SpoIIE family protein phosphatase [Bacteroidetes bacterium]|nr:SpoIIE family protein phosphatase [Bacteroidota bacterium]